MNEICLVKIKLVSQHCKVQFHRRESPVAKGKFHQKEMSTKEEPCYKREVATKEVLAVEGRFLNFS